jgi:hypothetical protein
MKPKGYDCVGRLIEHVTTTRVMVLVAAVGVGFGVKRFLQPSALAAIPGPPSQSFIFGHFKAIFEDKDAAKFCMEITEEYGGVLKLKTFFGVS